MTMNKRTYMLSVDQSTQGTKALLFDRKGRLLKRRDVAHRQIIDEKGWVEHDLEEIWKNTRLAVKQVLEAGGILPEEVAGLGISNQRETIGAWNRTTGKPVYHGIVWQCARGEAICERLKEEGKAGLVKERTGLDLSPYFSAAKLAWIFNQVPEAASLAQKGELCCGTIDAWLIYKLTGGKAFLTEYSNASRTQLFNIKTLQWDPEICGIFGIPVSCLPRVCDSDTIFGMTDFDGLFQEPIPVCCALGDSQGALYGQGCHRPGEAKATYGTGSSVMMNTGQDLVFSDAGLVSSIAWGRGGQVRYVLEGNINYTGAVITWMKDNLGIIASAGETQKLALEANPEDKTYMVPAFSGLGAPYWDSRATTLITGITRLTGRKELVKAGLDCIAYQIFDVVSRMGGLSGGDEGCGITSLQADGGPTKNRYLMQFQSDILHVPISVPEHEELSGIGAAYMGGIRLGLYGEDELFGSPKKTVYRPQMADEERSRRIRGWENAVRQTLSGQPHPRPDWPEG